MVREGPLEYELDLWKGQKTGLFLDQRENRDAAARDARGRLLGCLSYNGGFGLRRARTCPEAEGRRGAGADLTQRRCATLPDELRGGLPVRIRPDFLSWCLQLVEGGRFRSARTTP